MDCSPDPGQSDRAGSGRRNLDEEEEVIVVKVELWPGGDESRAVDLGKALIANESGLADVSRYSIRLLKGAAYSKRPGETYKTGEVAAFPRKDKRWGPWELLALALEATVGGRIAGLKRHLGNLRGERPGT